MFLSYLLTFGMFLFQSPLDTGITNVYSDITGVWPKLIGSCILGLAYIGHRTSDTDGILHRFWPLLVGVGFLAWAPSIYTWLF